MAHQPPLRLCALACTYKTENETGEEIDRRSAFPGKPWTGARYSQPFLDSNELDYCAALPSIFPFVTAVRMPTAHSPQLRSSCLARLCPASRCIFSFVTAVRSHQRRFHGERFSTLTPSVHSDFLDLRRTHVVARGAFPGVRRGQRAILRVQPAGYVNQPTAAPPVPPDGILRLRTDSARTHGEPTRVYFLENAVCKDSYVGSDLRSLLRRHWRLLTDSVLYIALK